MRTPLVSRFTGRSRSRTAPRAPDTTARAEVLRDRWLARSRGAVWPGTVADWRCPPVDALCEALVSHRTRGPQAADASRSLGEQRAKVGAHLIESRLDLEVVFEIVEITATGRLELLDALTVGWAEYSVDRFTAVPALDRNQMATLSYLMTRLGELYREAELNGDSVARDHVLVVADTEDAPSRLVAEARLTALHSALQYAFVGGESIVALGSNRVLALARRDEPRLSDSLARLTSELKIALAEGRLPSARTWRQTLPRDPAELSLSLLGVAY